MSPIPILVVILMAAAAAAGWTGRGWRENSVRLDEERQRRQSEFQQTERFEAARAGITAQRKRTTAEIDHVAKTSAGAGLCFDPDSLRILGDAVKGAGVPMRAADGAQGRDADRSAPLGDRSDLRLPGVRGESREDERALTP